MKRHILGVLAGTAMLIGLAPPAMALQGTQRLTLVLKTPASGRAIASGMVNGQGPVTGDEETGVVTVSLPQGSLSFTVIPGTSEEHGNLRACVVTFSSTDTIEIVGGTGVFSNVSGTGVATGRGTAVGPRNPDGSCNPEGENVSFLAVIRINATLHLPAA